MGIYGIPDEELGIQRKEAEDTSTYGHVEGDICNRYGCKGVIVDGEREGEGCTCHRTPPCSYCCQNVGYCPECGWDAKDEDQP